MREKKSYTLINNITKEEVRCLDMDSLTSACDELGLKASTLLRAERAIRQPREPLWKVVMDRNEDIKSNSSNLKIRKVKNVLAIGDLHIPFEHPQALEFCKKVCEINDIDEIIFMGDEIDNHAISYHESDIDGMSAGDELLVAKKRISKWSEAFPKAKCLHSNHGDLAIRKAFSAGLPKAWIRSNSEVLGNSWDYADFHEIGNFLFTHGLGQQAKSRANDIGMSVIQGHLHSKMNAHYEDGLWSVQTGCLIDMKSYAMAYGKFGKRARLGCCIIQDIYGKNPTVKLIKMGDLGFNGGRNEDCKL